jgi:REP element-mobilizing transposase RayT
MPNTYSQIYLQLVFATKGREAKIGATIKDEVEKYICGIFRNKGQKVLAIYANPDHIHILFSYKNLRITVPELVKIVKTESTNFINETNLTSDKFFWQEGYGVFSYSKSQKDSVSNYIFNQAKHHQRRSFREEYLDFLSKFEIEYDDKYLFDFYD